MARPIVVTGGGTGGHIFPMVAIADALRSAGLAASDLRYVGSRRGQEERLLGDGPIALTRLPGRGIKRSLRPRAVVDNVGAVVSLVAAMITAGWLVARWRPRAVVSVGGYASFAVSVAALLWRRPLILVDLDATPPATHRVLARFATRRCVAFGEAGPKTVVTGAPVRAAIAAIDRSLVARARAKAALAPPISPTRTVVVVMTGSLGAGSVNRAVVALAERWDAREDLTLVHITGRRDEAWVRREAPVTTGLDYRIEAFGDMVTWWAVADVAICRAGATTVAELSLLHLPAVVVPLPGAPGDHQTANARALVEQGSAVLLRDGDVSADTLAPAVTALVASSSDGSPTARRDAAAAIAQTVLAVVS